MNKVVAVSFIFIVALFSIFSSNAHQAYERLMRRTVVDTVSAAALMKSYIDKENQPSLSKIAKLKDSIQEKTLKNRVYTDSLTVVKYLIDNFNYKIKDQSLKEYYLAYFTDVFEKSPLNDILALAKEKDVEKARNKKNAEEALLKLQDKTREKALKDISKGKLEAVFITDTLLARNARFKNNIDLLNAGINRNMDSISEIEKQIKRVPVFGRRAFIEVTGNAQVPIKEIIVVPVSAFGKDSRTYAQLAKQYPDFAAEGITGKFDGFIEDRLALFPFGEMKTIELGGDTIIALNNVIVKSEKGTVPDLILNSEVLKLGLGDPQFGLNKYGINLGLSSVSGIWQPKELPMDGLRVSFSPMEPFTDGLQCGYGTMFVIENGRWICKTPLETEYLTFDECLSLWSDFFQKRGVDMSPAQFRYNTEYGDGKIDIMWFPSGNPDDINDRGGLAKLVNPEIVFKCSGIEDLILPATNFDRWKVFENFFGEGNDGLVVSYEFPPEKGGDYTDVYQIEFDGPFGYSLNGIERSSEFGWHKRCTIVEDLKTKELLPIKISDINTISGSNEILEGTAVSNDENEIKFLIMSNRLTGDSIDDISVKVWADGEFMGSLKPELYRGRYGDDNRINMPGNLLTKFEQVKGCMLSGEESVFYYESQKGRINELVVVDNNILLKIDGKDYSGKLKSGFIYGDDALAEFVGEKFADSYDETPEFLQCQGVDQSNCKNLKLGSSQAKTLLEGVVYGSKVNEATILSTTRLGKNWLIEYNVDNGRLYDAIYTPQGTLLDALYLGYQPTLDDTSSWDDSRERTRVERLGPRRIKVTVFKAIKDSYGLNAHHHEFSYVISDGAFILTSAVWNNPECANPYKWAYIEPAEFLRRFPESQTPWGLWYELSRKVDGENAEGFWWDDMPELYRRNREVFLKQAASDFLNGRKKLSVALDFLAREHYGEEYLDREELKRDVRNIEDQHVKGALDSFFSTLKRAD